MKNYRFCQLVTPKKMYFKIIQTNIIRNVVLLRNRNFYSTRNTLHSNNNDRLNKNKSLLMYTASILMFGLGLTYAAVPLYRKFCQMEALLSYLTTTTTIPID